MRTRDQIEAELKALGWKITAGPSQSVDGWEATMARGTVAVKLNDWTELSLLEAMLRHAQRKAGGQP